MSKNKKRNKKINNKLKEINNSKKINVETKVIEVEKEILEVKINHLNHKILTNKLKYILIILTALILSMIIYFGSLSPNIVLIGNENLVLEVNNEYQELGYKANYFVKDITNEVIINSNLNTEKMGNYKIEYVINYKGKTKKVIRNIEVKDTTRPIIELSGEKEIYICSNKKYEELGYKAIDNYDGDITDKVKIKINDSEILYQVEDSSNNKTVVTRKTINKDIEKPVINLNGGTATIIYLGNDYEELGYSAVDNCDGDITKNVIVSNNLNVNVLGNYKINYKVKDSSGNESSIDRSIKVLDPKTTGKIIYLTFDDGPSSITSSILDILKEENIKATFFVTGNANYYPDIIKREVNEGHTVALHTFTHDYKTVYKSSDAYFNDLNMIRNTIYNITGKYSNIIRFPGGSSNTISSNYQKGLMTLLAKEVEEKGFIYFDWNVSSEDAGSAWNSSQVYNNVVNNLKYKNDIVLLHDFGGNYKTLNALRDIIKYGKRNGYTFETITEYTEPVHHRINN